MAIEYLRCFDRPESGTRWSCYFVVDWRTVTVKLTESAAGQWDEWANCETFCRAIGHRAAELLVSSRKSFADGAVLRVRADRKLWLHGGEGEDAVSIADLSHLTNR